MTNSTTAYNNLQMQALLNYIQSAILLKNSHGGPGSGSDPNVRRFYDPQAYRIIVFDQRGCGKSRPSAELKVK